MKYLLLITFFLSSALLFSQEKFPLISKDNGWKIGTYCPECGLNYNDLYCENLKDTIIDGEEVMQFFINEEQLQAIEKENKTFIKRVGIDSNFILLYDFNLTVGDTFFTEYSRGFSGFSIDSFKLVVKSIDSVEMYDGTKRKRINFEEQVYPDNPLGGCGGNMAFWIDGIGNSTYPFYSLLACFEVATWLDCFSFQDVEILLDCLYDKQINEDLNDLKVYPNPIQEYLIIESSETIKEIYLTDLMGHTFLIQMDEQGKYNTSNMNPGIYILTILFEQNRIESRKIMLSN